MGAASLSRVPSLNLRTLLRLVEAELDRRRLYYLDVRLSAHVLPTCADLAASLAQREASSIEALEGLEQAAPEPARWARVRVGWLVPFLASPPPSPPMSVDGLLDFADETDALFELLQRHLQRRASAVPELESVARGMGLIARSRQLQLEHMVHELRAIERRAVGF